MASYWNTLASKYASNQDGELNPGEDLVMTLYNEGGDRVTETGAITVGGKTVVQEATAEGNQKFVVPAPEQIGEQVVKFAGHRVGTVTIEPGDQESPNRTPSELGYTGSSFGLKTYAEPGTMNDWEPAKDPIKEPEPEPDPIDPADHAGIVNADNEQGYRLAPNFRGVYESAQSLLSDAQDGTLDKLNSDESSQSSSPSPPSSSMGSTTTSDGLSRQVVVGAVVAVVAGAAALLGGN